jgi:glycosyltransferase involved in cell wall biosynthesis
VTIGSETVPRVSVITTVYNAASFLEPTLRSLLAQTFRDFEAVVVDDGSTDDSAALVELIAAGDSRIRLIRQANTGVADALNRGLVEARGEFIALLDHDDLWQPTKLARQVELLDRDETVGFVGCYSALLDAGHRHLGWRFGNAVQGNVYRRMLFCDLVAGGSVALVRRTAFEQSGFFDPSTEIEGRSDWDQWLRLSRNWNYAMVEESLVGYTRRPSNYSADYQRMIQAGEAVLNKAAASDPELDDYTVRKALSRDAFGIFCLSLADRKLDEAGKLLRRSVSLSWRPVLLSPRRWVVLLLFALSGPMREDAFERLWRVIARTAFKLTPGEAFMREQAPPSSHSE